MTKEINKCQYCGRRNSTVSMHSGVYECDKCWYFRKMDYPAAEHYAKTAKGFIEKVDLYDWTQYFPNRVGLTKEQMSIMLNAAGMVEATSRYFLDHGPEHRWDEETRRLYDEEMAHYTAPLAQYTITKQEEEPTL
jgi:hypothetical protein